MDQPHFKDIRFRGKSHKYFVTQLGPPRFSEIDAYKVVWNGNYVNYFEEVRMAMLRQFDVKLDDMTDAGFFFPVYKMTLCMRKPISQGEDMLGACRTEIVDGVVRFHQFIVVNSEIRATGEVDQMVVDAASMTPIFTPPEALRKILLPMVACFESTIPDSFLNSKTSKGINNAN